MAPGSSRSKKQLNPKSSYNWEMVNNKPTKFEIQEILDNKTNQQTPKTTFIWETLSNTHKKNRTLNLAVARIDPCKWNKSGKRRGIMDSETTKP